MPKVSCCPFRLHVYTFLVSGGWKQIFLAIVFCRDPSSSFFSEIFRYSIFLRITPTPRRKCRRYCRHLENLYFVDFQEKKFRSRLNHRFQYFPIFFLKKFNIGHTS